MNMILKTLAGSARKRVESQKKQMPLEELKRQILRMDNTAMGNKPDSTSDNKATVHSTSQHGTSNNKTSKCNKREAFAFEKALKGKGISLFVK